PLPREAGHRHPPDAGLQQPARISPRGPQARTSAPAHHARGQARCPAEQRSVQEPVFRRRIADAHRHLPELPPPRTVAAWGLGGGGLPPPPPVPKNAPPTPN